MESPSRGLTILTPTSPTILSNSGSLQRRRSGSSSTYPDFEFEFWRISSSSSFPHSPLHSADELFSDGFLLPLHHLPQPPSQPHPPQPHLDISPSITSTAGNPILTASKRWKDIFKRPPKSDTTVAKSEKRREKKPPPPMITETGIPILILFQIRIRIRILRSLTSTSGRFPGAGRPGTTQVDLGRPARRTGKRAARRVPGAIHRGSPSLPRSGPVGPTVPVGPEFTSAGVARSGNSGGTGPPSPMSPGEGNRREKDVCMCPCVWGTANS